jgi:hypothetical protein
MHQAAVSPLPAWENFYVIIGSAAAALTGLMFIVITLIAGMGKRRSSSGIGTYSTPTVVHFCVALALAAILSAPWPAFWEASPPLGLAGLGGLIYSVIIFWRLRRQHDYQPVIEDWLWHVALPLTAYIAIVIAAILLPSHPTPALFVIAAMMMLFLFIGIHNAWDIVTYLIIEDIQSENRQQS